MRICYCGIRFFFVHVLQRNWHLFDVLRAKSEARLPAIWGKLGAVAFLDYGNVWPGIFEFGKLRYAVGPGLRYLTPIGPARFDFGWQLAPIDNLRVNGDPEQRHWRVHFSIGQAF